MTRPTFPILGSGARIDLQLVIDHGKQAQANHYQTVARLAERGGLCWVELYAVLHNRPFQSMDENIAIAACRGVEARYLAAIQIPDNGVSLWKEGYLEGFRASGEGWNGEHPFAGSPEEDPHWLEVRELLFTQSKTKEIK